MKFIKYLKESYIETHLRERGVDFSSPRFPVYIDKKQDIAYFPLFNLSGKFVGYQKYNPKGVKWSTKDSKSTIQKHGDEVMKYKSYITKENPERKIGHIALYGLHTLDHRKYVFITEGIFDAAKLIALGYPTIAVLSNNPKHLKPFFFALQKKVIAILDNDDAGKTLKSIADMYLTVPDPHKDLGDMTTDEVREFLINSKYRQYFI